MMVQIQKIWTKLYIFKDCNGEMSVKIQLICLTHCLQSLSYIYITYHCVCKNTFLAVTMFVTACIRQKKKYQGFIS